MEYVIKALEAIAVFLVSKLICVLVKRSINKLDEYAESRGLSALDISESTKQTIFRVTRYITYSIAFVIVLYIFDLNGVITAILTAAGVSGIAIGFAARDIISNALSGIMLIFDRPFRIGDKVSIGKYVSEGTVEAIEIRKTVLKASDGRIITIPNSKILTEVVVNYSLNPKRMLELTVEVDVDSNVKKALKLIDKIVDNLEWKASAPKSKVFIEDVTKDNVIIKIQIWTQNKQIGEKKAELFYKVRDALKKHNIASSIIRN